MKKRCWKTDNPLYIAYHDDEWGVPVHDDRTHFEFLVLEGAQAGLSWETVLNKREAYRAAFDGFDFEKVSRYGEEKVGELLSNPGIIRNRRKVASAVNNAARLIEVREEFGTFDSYVWKFVGNATIIHSIRSMAQMPAYTPEAEAMSASMKRRGFSFVGPTICYSYMQATGMVLDHLKDCFRYGEILARLKEKKASIIYKDVNV